MALRFPPVLPTATLMPRLRPVSGLADGEVPPRQAAFPRSRAVASWPAFFRLPLRGQRRTCDLLGRAPASRFIPRMDIVGTPETCRECNGLLLTLSSVSATRRGCSTCCEGSCLLVVSPVHFLR